MPPHRTSQSSTALALTRGLPGCQRPAPTPGRRPECTSRPRCRRERPQIPYAPGLAEHSQKLPRCRRSACIAQRVEQAPSKRLAAGSSPAGGAQTWLVTALSDRQRRNGARGTAPFVQSVGFCAPERGNVDQLGIQLAEVRRATPPFSSSCTTSSSIMCRSLAEA